MTTTWQYKLSRYIALALITVTLPLAVFLNGLIPFSTPISYGVERDSYTGMLLFTIISSALALCAVGLAAVDRKKNPTGKSAIVTSLFALVLLSLTVTTPIGMGLITTAGYIRAEEERAREEAPIIEAQNRADEQFAEQSSFGIMVSELLMEQSGAAVLDLIDPELIATQSPEYYLKIIQNEWLPFFGQPGYTISTLGVGCDVENVNCSVNMYLYNKPGSENFKNYDIAYVNKAGKKYLTSIKIED